MATATEPYCNHDAIAVRNGICECGQRVSVPFGDFMRSVLDLFPNAQIGYEDDDEDGQLIVYTGLREVHSEAGSATVEPIKIPNLTGV